MFAALPVLKPISLITSWSFLLAEKKNNFKNPPISYPVSFCHNQLQQLIFLFKSPVLQSSVIVPNLYKLLVSRFSTNCFFSPSTNYPTLLQPSLHTHQSYVLLDLSKNYSFNSSLFTQYHARISMYFTYMEKWVYLPQDSCLFSSATDHHSLKPGTQCTLCMDIHTYFKSLRIQASAAQSVDTPISACGWLVMLMIMMMIARWGFWAEHS